MDSAETNPAAEAPAPAAIPANSGVAAKPFDFRHPVFLSSAEWRKLRIELDEFVESIGALLSTYLRLEFGLQIGKLQTVSFNEFTSTVPSPTQLALFKLEPMRGISILEMRPVIGSAIVDRLLGGPGQPINPPRNLSEMEVALLDQVVQVLLNEWTKQWSKVQDLRAEILGHENNPKFLQSSSGDTIMLVATLEARMGECVDQIQLAFPYSTLEPLVKKLAQSGGPSSATTQAPQPPAIKWNRTLDDVPITVSAQWPTMKITTRALLTLKPGEILELNPELSEKIEIRLGSVTKFKGRLGTRENKWAIEITEISKSS
jgi:flagellar motor switch protein FliM